MQIERASGNGGEDVRVVSDEFRFTVDPQPVPRSSAFRLAGSTMLRGGGIFAVPLEPARMPAPGENNTTLPE